MNKLSVSALDSRSTHTAGSDDYCKRYNKLHINNLGSNMKYSYCLDFCDAQYAGVPAVPISYEEYMCVAKKGARVWTGIKAEYVVKKGEERKILKYDFRGTKVKNGVRLLGKPVSVSRILGSEHGLAFKTTPWTCVYFAGGEYMEGNCFGLNNVNVDHCACDEGKCHHLHTLPVSPRSSIVFLEF